MSDIPLPGPPLSDEEEAAHETAAYEAQVWLAWNDALEWAQKGAWPELSTLLRSSMPLEHQEVRNFLADILEGKIKRRAHRPPTRPKRSWDIFATGIPSMVDKRDLPLNEMKKWMRDNEHRYSSEDALVAAAAEYFRLHETTIRNAKSRSFKAYAKSRTKPPR